MSKETISRERLEAPPGTIYAETIPEPSHLFMLEHYFSPLASRNKAWTVMLVETGIVDEDRGATLLDAILDLEAAGPEAIGDFDPRYEYFYSHVERFLTERIGEEIAGPRDNVRCGSVRSSSRHRSRLTSARRPVKSSQRKRTSSPRPQGRLKHAEPGLPLHDPAQVVLIE